MYYFSVQFLLMMYLMRFFLYLSIFLFGKNLYAQSNDTLHYNKLHFIESCAVLPEISMHQNKIPPNKNYYFTEEYKGERSLFFIKKVANEYRVYHFESGHYAAWTFCEINAIDENLIKIQSYRAFPGTCAATYGQSIIFDLELLQYISFFHSESSTCDDENGDPKSFYECKAEVLLHDDVLKIKQDRSTDTTACNYCIESGYYHKTNQGYVKTHYFSDAHHQYFKYNCLANICRGMSLQELKNRFPKAVYTPKKAYLYGYDTDVSGLEISHKDEKLLFVTHDNKVLTGISFIAPSYKFNGIAPGTRINNVLQKYPSKLYIDLITNFEYITLDSLGIRLVFMTDKNNRIGKYEMADAPASEILRKEAPIDIIQMN